MFGGGRMQEDSFGAGGATGPASSNETNTFAIVIVLFNKYKIIKTYFKIIKIT